MGFEFVLSDYLVCVGAMAFFSVALSELVRASHTGLPKSALGSLFLLVAGACFGSLGASGETTPLEVIRAFLSLSNIVSVQGLSLLLIVTIIVYLAGTLHPGESDVPTRVICLFGAVVSLVLCAYLLYHTVQLGEMSLRGMALYAVAFVTNAMVTGFTLFVISCQFDLGAEEVSPGERTLVLVACAMQVVAFGCFTASFLLQLSTGGMLVPSELVGTSVSALWTSFAVVGLGGTLVAGVAFYRAKAAQHRAQRERTVLLCLLGCSVASGIVLQGILQLSNWWTA